MQTDPIVIVSIARTPQGNLSGVLKEVTAPQLGSTVIKAVVERAHLQPTDIQEVIMGCVLPAGIGQAPARQASLGAGIPISTPCTTLNKMCGSGMQAVIFAHDSLLAGTRSVYIAGGMESMTNAPYLIPKARQGYRLGNAEILDHLMYDGLEDAYEKKPMGHFAEKCAKEYNFTRAEQDNYARTSLERAQKAIQEKSFTAEITPVTIKTRQGEQIITTDEHPGSVNAEKIPHLPPIFLKDGGTVTAANSSSIADGAAALVLMRLSEATKRGIKPLAHIIGHHAHAKAPADFPTAPIDAIQKLLKKINWAIEQVDLFEINEAFAVVAMAAMRDLNIPHEKLNIHGSGCALGHPIGATGARIIVTLVAALQKYSLKRGVAALCIGGGEATAIAVEII